MDAASAARRIDQEWSVSILPSLEAYIRVPNKSPLFDPEWEAHGHMDRAAAILVDWCRTQPVAGLRVEVIRLPGRTPVIFAEVPGTAPGEVLAAPLVADPAGDADREPEREVLVGLGARAGEAVRHRRRQACAAGPQHREEIRVGVALVEEDGLAGLDRESELTLEGGALRGAR